MLEDVHRKKSKSISKFTLKLVAFIFCSHKNHDSIFILQNKRKKIKKSGTEFSQH